MFEFLGEFALRILRCQSLSFFPAGTGTMVLKSSLTELLPFSILWIHKTIKGNWITLYYKFHLFLISFILRHWVDRKSLHHLSRLPNYFTNSFLQVIFFWVFQPELYLTWYDSTGVSMHRKCFPKPTKYSSVCGYEKARISIRVQKSMHCTSVCSYR